MSLKLTNVTTSPSILLGELSGGLGDGIRHVGAAEHVEIGVDVEMLHGAFGCGIEIDEEFAVDIALCPLVVVDDLEVVGLQSEIELDGGEFSGIDRAVDHERVAVGSPDVKLIEADNIVGEHDGVVVETELGADHGDEDPYGVAAYRPVEHGGGERPTHCELPFR